VIVRHVMVIRYAELAIIVLEFRLLVKVDFHPNLELAFVSSIDCPRVEI